MADEIAWDNLVFVKGDTLDEATRSWEFLDANDAIENLTGFSAKLDMRASFNEDDTTVPILQLSSDGGTLIITPLSGKIAPAVPSATTSALAAGDYVFDLETTHTASSTIKTRVRGEVRILPEATRV